MRKIMRFSERLPTFVGLIRYIPYFDRKYQAYYPAHHEYEKHTWNQDYGRVGLPTTQISQHASETNSIVSEMTSDFQNHGIFEIMIRTIIQAIFTLPHILQHIANMLKDLIDTVRPYKSDFYSRRDWYQPLTGLKNIITAILDFIIRLPLVPIMLIDISIFMVACVLGVVIFGVATPFSKTARTNFLKSFALFFIRPLSILPMLIVLFVDPVIRVIRGVTQFITFPLTYIFKKAIRSMLTPKGYQSMASAEANNTILMLVAKLKVFPAPKQSADPEENAQSETCNRLNKAFILHTIHFKYAKSIWKEKTFDKGIQQEEARLYKAFTDAKDTEIKYEVEHPYDVNEIVQAQDEYAKYVTEQFGNT